jgi:hypothetical protein
MKCTNCGHDTRRLHTIYANGEYQCIGGKATSYRTKRDYCEAMKYSNYFGGYWNNQEIMLVSSNHCWQCGQENAVVCTVF